MTGCKKDQTPGAKTSAVNPEQPTAFGTPTPSVVTETSSPARPKDWAVAEEFDFDWKGDGSPAHFKIEQSMEEQVSRLTIHMNGQPDFVLDNDDIWEIFADSFYKGEDFLKKNSSLVS
jgi:hypothetical protein